MARGGQQRGQGPVRVAQKVPEGMTDRNRHTISPLDHYTGWAKKNGLFLRVDNFAMVGVRSACDMSKFSYFYLERECKTFISVH